MGEGPLAYEARIYRQFRGCLSRALSIAAGCAGPSMRKVKLSCNPMVSEGHSATAESCRDPTWGPELIQQDPELELDTAGAVSE